ncbi:hypothetical protein ABVT39_023376 [Epinephelus coioides]
MALENHVHQTPLHAQSQALPLPAVSMQVGTASLHVCAATEEAKEAPMILLYPRTQSFRIICGLQLMPPPTVLKVGHFSVKRVKSQWQRLSVVNIKTVKNGQNVEQLTELIEDAGLENSNLPPNPVIGKQGSGEAGEGEGPAIAPPVESVEEDGVMQAEGGTSTEQETDSEDATLPNAQQAKRPISELSSDSPVVTEKKGRAGDYSDSSSVEEPRVFPSDSPNEASFLTIALQSTPKDSKLNATLRQRPTPRVRRGNGVQPPHFSPIEVKEELHSHECD